MMFFLMACLFFLYRTLSLNHEVRILQLNHYQIRRQADSLMSRHLFGRYVWWRILFHVPFLVLVAAPQRAHDLCSMMLVVYIYVGFKFTQVNQKKSTLKYTRRVQRLYILLFFIYTFILHMGYTSDRFMWYVMVLMWINKEMVFLANLLITPLEKGIQLFYIMQAKRVLQAHEQLIKVGIVGSYGKTSTKNMLYHFLKEHYLCLKSKHSYNNMMGNTRTIRQELKRIHDLFIVEMGSDHVGEIARLMKFVEPQYVIITSIGNQHLNTFYTQENIVYEKTSPLLLLGRQDVAFLNIDNAYIYDNRELGVCRKITFGEHSEAQFRLKDVVLFEWGARFMVSYNGVDTPFQTSLLGYYNTMDLLGSICVAHTLEVPMRVLQRLCAVMKPVEHRLQSIQKKHYTLIDNAYNSNVLSFKNSLQILKNINKYTILVTPGLLDLKDDAKENEALMEGVEGCCDEVVLVGYMNRKAMVKGLKKHNFSAYQCMDTMEEALAYLEDKTMFDFVALIENDIDKSLMNLKI